jgi:hypothetical protein
MIRLQKGLASQNIIVTLSESVTVANPTYVFTFTSVALKGSKEITFTYTKADDLSSYQDRFNKFLFDESLLNELPVGQYRYKVVQQENNVTLEVGKMQLIAESTINKYEHQTTTERYGR